MAKNGWPFFLNRIHKVTPNATLVRLPTCCFLSFLLCIWSFLSLITRDQKAEQVINTLNNHLLSVCLFCFGLYHLLFHLWQLYLYSPFAVIHPLLLFTLSSLISSLMLLSRTFPHSHTLVSCIQTPAPELTLLSSSGDRITNTPTLHISPGVKFTPWNSPGHKNIWRLPHSGRPAEFDPVLSTRWVWGTVPADE